MSEKIQIASTFPCYNEMKYLPAYKKWCDSEGIIMAMIDNYSNDRSYEWGIENCQFKSRLDTNDTFDLSKILIAKQAVNSIVDADWITRGGVDTFIFADKPLIKLLDDQYDIYEFDLLEIYNTGEKSEDLLDHYYYKLMKHKAPFIHKNIKLKYIPDNYDKQYKRFYVKNGCVINYGGAKPAAEREETFERRKRAWEAGLHSGWGVHYIKGHEKGWLWDKAELQDLRQSRYWYFLKDKLKLLR